MWARLKALPWGLWVALSAAFTVFLLFLRGRRIEAELAHTKVQLEASRAKAETSAKRHQALAHYSESLHHAQRIKELETARSIVKSAGTEEQKRLAALPPDEVHDAYMKLAEEKQRVRVAEEKRFGRAKP